MNVYANEVKECGKSGEGNVACAYVWVYLYVYLCTMIDAGPYYLFISAVTGDIVLHLQVFCPSLPFIS